MALEASIVERLQELRRWQAEQQERLLQHQQEQRATLNREQVRMYQALGLSIQNNSSEEVKADNIFKDSLEEDPDRSTTSKKYENLLKTNIGNTDTGRHISPQRRHELLHSSSPALKGDDKNSPNVEKELFQTSDKNLRSNSLIINRDDKNPTDSESETHKPCRIISELSIDGIAPLPLDKAANKSLLIDDIPLPSPKKDFHTLLEERLREPQNALENNGFSDTTKKTMKRPFLKKGQGLARFRLGGSAPVNGARQIRPRSMSLPSGVRKENVRNAKMSTEKPNDAPKAVGRRTADTRTEKAQKKHPPIPNTAQSRLSLKNVQPPVRIRSKSLCNPREALIQSDNQFREIDRFNSSDIESKTKREMEEVRIFELLEEKAENSSFCSTSSTVVALLQQSVQSTPLKGKSVNKNRISTLAQNWRNEKDDTNEDLLLAEIVYTTQSNNMVHNSAALAYKKQYQNDIDNIQNENDIQLDDNVKPHQFSNDDVFYESSSDNICELPYGTDIDTNYDAGFPRNDETNHTSNQDFECQVNYEKNTSLHVRFAEFNEYKTIGLTDTSTISNESEAPRHYSDERAWSDCSATTDSSDAEDFSSAMKHDRLKNLENHVALQNKLKTIQPKQINGENYKKPYQFHEDLTRGQLEDQYCTANNTDVEQQSEQNRGNHHDEDISHSSSEQNDDCENSTAQTEALALADSTLVEEEEIGSVETHEDNGLIFKSELLKTRLLELEQEIEIFRKENIAVTTIKEKLQEERRTLERNYKEKERRFEERKQKMESTLQEEKKKLVREKTALESRLKDANVKAQQSKQERLEVQNLRDQLEELKEEMNQKESRWNAAQARHRSQVRILQSENSKLKQDIEKLRSTRKVNTKARLHTKFSNTKAIHQINKQLESQKQTRRKKNSTSDEEEFLMQPMMEAMHLNENHNVHVDSDKINSDGSKMIIYDRSQTELKNRNDIARKRDLYQNLLKDATMGLKEGEEATKKAVQGSENKRNLSKGNKQSVSPVVEIIQSQDPPDSDEISAEADFDQKENVAISRSGYIAEINEDDARNGNNSFEKDINRENHLENYISSIGLARNKEAANSAENRKQINSNDNNKVDKQGIREVQHPDGRIEFWYPNGNVKKISADGTITKLIYYNGDVCESRRDGSVKYFYATTRTWHTTMSDGLEIFEFPDGQVERRSRDGTVEVSFPDGSVRILQSNGTEKWALPDGTLAETSADGEKILILPNGQREVHTKEHKRREYPDGTVKLVYPDGTQETRYAGGRIRLKDKDGNLLMDSHHQ